MDDGLFYRLDDPGGWKVGFPTARL